jgi:large subunit ribosomal protein L9
VRAGVTRARSHARSSAPASSRCSPTSPKAVAIGLSGAAAATVTATATGSETPMPQAILLQDVESLGERGDVVDVSPGYLRNYLVPRKLAESATAGSIQAAQRRRDDAERAQREAEERAQENASVLGRTVLTIAQQAGDDGRLFGSVTPQDIADAIRDARGIRIDRRKVHLEDPIRHTGTYMVVVEVADGVTATIKTMVVPAG